MEANEPTNGTETAERVSGRVDRLVRRDAAEAYRVAHGHYPLVVGLEYEFMDGWVRLIEASEWSRVVTVESRFGTQTKCDKDELGWKPDRL